ncbi:MBOAT family O-acyltransferase, partial [Clostridium tarantellae]
SILFIFRFLPFALIIYYLTPNKGKNIILILLSLIFYSWGEPKYFILMILSILVDFFIALAIERNSTNKLYKSIFLLLSILFNLAMLFLFKYINFFINNFNDFFKLSITNVNLTLPLGISFYTFQTMSYTIDVFKGKTRAERNIINFGAYVSLFPQLIAGPIVKYTDIKKELLKKDLSFKKVEKGLKLFILGLAKKVLIANNIGMLWTEVEKIGFEKVSTPLAWMGVLAFSLQIYFDFSGYSTMAIGLGKMLGFNFPENFNFPYISRSISEFWRRWHITLGAWFKEYVYIPLGGNKGSKTRLCVNLVILWFLTGFWHGSSYNFILWGLFFFILIYIEKIGFIKILNTYKVFSHIYVSFFLIIGWCIFAITDLKELINLFNRMFIFHGGI